MLKKNNAILILFSLRETNLVNFHPAGKKIASVIFITLLLCENKLDQVPILVIILIKGQLVTPV